MSTKRLKNQASPFLTGYRSGFCYFNNHGYTLSSFIVLGLSGLVCFIF